MEDMRIGIALEYIRIGIGNFISGPPVEIIFSRYGDFDLKNGFLVKIAAGMFFLKLSITQLQLKLS